MDRLLSRVRAFRLGSILVFVAVFWLARAAKPEAFHECRAYMPGHAECLSDWAPSQAPFVPGYALDNCEEMLDDGVCLAACEVLCNVPYGFGDPDGCDAPIDQGGGCYNSTGNCICAYSY